MQLEPLLIKQLRSAARTGRLVDIAKQLCSIYSPTGNGKEVADCLAEILGAEGLSVERPDGGWTKAPAVAVRLDSGQTGRTLQLDGHLDTVHLPFVPPAVDGDRLTGSGSSDMKAGVAAAVEAVLVLRDTGLLSAGSVLLTAHDLHEAPWGDNSQLEGLIAAGYVGHGVLISEYLRDHLAVVGRGMAILKVTISRDGPPVHEVYRPANEPSVIAAGAQVVNRFAALARELEERSDAIAGSESIFVGHIQSGEIYNQYPQTCRIEGTRRWLPSNERHAVESQFRQILRDVADESGASIEGVFHFVRDAFYLNEADPLVAAFDAACVAVSQKALPRGGKPFVDDGNTFWARAGVPAITHGPKGGGAHTLEEWVSIEDLARVAVTYAATAVAYCGASS